MTLRFLSKIFLVCAVLCAATSARAADGFTLSSPDYAEGATLREAQVYAGFGCSGGNQSPALTWDNPPAGTQSFALTLYDPDAPTGSGWWHWVVFDIPADVRALPLDAAGTGARPAGAVQSLTDFGAPGFGGACPPEGDKPHRYIFTLYALDVPKLGLDAGTMPAMVGFTLAGHTLGKAVLTTHYGR